MDLHRVLTCSRNLQTQSYCKYACIVRATIYVQIKSLVVFHCFVNEYNFFDERFR